MPVRHPAPSMSCHALACTARSPRAPFRQTSPSLTPPSLVRHGHGQLVGEILGAQRRIRDTHCGARAGDRGDGDRGGAAQPGCTPQGAPQRQSRHTWAVGRLDSHTGLFPRLSSRPQPKQSSSGRSIASRRTRAYGPPARRQGPRRPRQQRSRRMSQRRRRRGRRTRTRTRGGRARRGRRRRRRRRRWKRWR